ncbi:MAG: sigma-54-dependent Fis family transcriptional regulator, partial [Deltaproteobacteria bacterium]
MQKILVIDDDSALAQTLKLYFQSKGIDVIVSSTAEEALSAWQNTQPDLVLLDVQLPDLNGPQLLAKAKEMKLEGEVVMITAFQDTEATLHALSLGAIDYLYKPLDLDDLDLLVKKIDLRKKEKEKIDKLTYAISETYKPKQIIGRSKGILNVVKAIVQVSKSPATVLIEGETGTGKELVAQTIHYQA